jgi:hypothetical protein
VKVCTVEGCDKALALVARGLCSMHRYRWEKYGSTDLPEREPFVPPPCKLNDCNRRAVGFGVCNAHLKRLHKYGSFDLPGGDFTTRRLWAIRLRDLGLKSCNSCRSVKMLRDFPQGKGWWDGLHSQCRACLAARFQADRDRLLAWSAAWKAANPDKVAMHRTTQALNKLRSKKEDLYGPDEAA